MTRVSRSAEEFEELVREHARLMASAIRRVCGRRHRELVPDVQQEVYVALWKLLNSGKTIDYPTSYLYKMALTTALAQVRKLERVDLAPVDPELDTAEIDLGWGGLLPVERSQLLEQVLGRLDEDPARALRAYLAGFNHQEVADLFGWSPSRARHLIYRSIERLKKAMGEP